MRLLHAKELRFEEFFDDKIPPYAILSHRWGPDEVSYRDFMDGRKKDGAGYKKILACCRYAAIGPRLQKTFTVPMDQITSRFMLSLRGESWYEWVWIDTCCIDKSSSAELSEAINSMFDWYANSEVCYAYLSDVTRSSDVKEASDQLVASQWFRRGWTLQELLAPGNLVLLDKNWDKLGTKSSLLSEIARATGIAERLLIHSWRMNFDCTVAEKFSWAATRHTSRVEDKTYCLLGLVGHNMPLLYGEGKKAFLRLQLEIIRTSNDESVFVWSGLGRAFSSGLVSGSPLKFENKYSKQEGEFSKIGGLQRPPYAVTNQGLQLQVPTVLVEQSAFLLPLNCQHYEGAELKGAYAILLEKSLYDGTWARPNRAYYASGLPKDSTVLFPDDSGKQLYIVPIAWVWSVRDLTKRESTIIYAQI